MAIFVLRMKTFSRSAGARGSRATSAAAYRAGERIRDLRTGATYDHRQRRDVLHKEIVLPRALEQSGASMRWARDRASLWNAAEQAEKQRNSRVAREFMLALPHELKAHERLQLARGFARELVERYHNAADLVIHAPRGDPRNVHAHLLTTTREVTREGLSRKTSLEWSGTRRHQQGLLRWGEERAWLRERWATLTNEALKAAHLEVRVSAEYAAQDPTKAPRLPSMAYYIERRRGHSVMAERMRERQQAATVEPTATAGPQRRPWLQRVRQQAQSTWMSLRQRLSAQPRANPAPERVVAVGDRPVPARDAALEATPSVESQTVHRTWERQSAYFSADSQALESIRRWKEYRAQVAANPDIERQHSQAAVNSHEAERGLDHDLGL